MREAPAAVPLADLYRGGFADTKALARRGDARASGAVAKQFEAYFVQQMLKSMRSASLGDPFASANSESYRDMFDHQLALRLAEGEGIGLADVLNRAIANVQPGAPAIAQWESNLSQALVGRAPHPAQLDSSRRGSFPANVIGTTKSSDAASVRTQEFANPQAFVDAMWPHAVEAARTLGLAPEVLVAQSALETGWGRHVMEHADGRSSFNLFGIKADVSWPGDIVRKPTLEFDDGIIKRIRANFRAYDGFASSFRDYVSFIQGQPRYATALTQVQSPRAYVEALQEAGYATDPRYAQKVLSLLGRITPETLAAN